MFKVEIKGLKEFRQELEKLGGNFKKELKAGVTKGARKVAYDANNNAKSHDWTMGKYYHVGEAKYTKSSNTAVVIYVGTKRKSLSSPGAKNYKEQGDYFYVRFPEYGTIHQSPKPTLRPALEKNEEYINECVKEGFEKAIKKIGGF